MRDAKTKQAFVSYLLDPKHHDQRFWQAIRNFSDYHYIFGWNGDLLAWSRLPEGFVNTFYIESDREESDE